MTSKLLKKLQITTRKLTASVPGLCCAGWRGVLTTAAAAFLAMGAANGLAEENSSVRLVSYEQIQASAESACSVTSSSSMSGNQLSWVSVSSPEARAIKAESAAVRPAVGARVSTNRVTLRPVSDPATAPSPIMDDLDMSALNLDGMDGVDLTTPSVAIPAPAGQPVKAVPAEGLSSGGAKSEIPAAENTEKPRAIEKSAAEQRVPNADELGLPSSKLPVPESGLVKPITSDSNATGEDPWKHFDRPMTLDNTCPRPRDMKEIGDITNDITPPDGVFPMDCPLTPEDEKYPVRQFAGTHVRWTAANTCHNPLYFEQPAVERYGHSVGFLQPVLSGAQFLLTVPALPYLMAIDPVNECEYSLGHYRPGSCAPYMWNPVPFTLRAAIVEGGVATALVFLIP